MAFDSVDALQKALADEVFHYATDKKKAAGRALGTLVEIVAFHTLLAWNLRDHVVIERRIPEFANPNILHNVEFSLHPVRRRQSFYAAGMSQPITAAKIRKAFPALKIDTKKSTQLLSKDGVKRNAAILGEGDSEVMVANIDIAETAAPRLTICDLGTQPFAMVECKRVGVEEGQKKGPQTIEKAKQGAYVANTVSSLQRIRLRSGGYQGLLEREDGSFVSGPYDEMRRRIIDGSSNENQEGFMLTVGVVSNHGNWFTSNSHNKELRVLAQSYDWLLFLTDAGLAQFIEDVLLNPTSELMPARQAFLQSYPAKPGANRFTKVRMAADADRALRGYFQAYASEVETWYNVISPNGASLTMLRDDLRKLAGTDS